MKRLVVIDGKSVFYRGYYAMPNLATRDGTPTGGVYGFAVLALQILKKLSPDYVVVAWDKSKTNIRSRRKLYPEYKANRKPMPDDMREQIPVLRELLEGFSWPLMEVDDYEADDIMGALAKQAQAKGIETILVTSDMDLLQLVDGNIQLYTLKKGLTNIVHYDDALIQAEFGFSKEKFDDYKALKGDSSDNIPGVVGIGDKTAKDLVQKYETLENIYEHIDNFKGALRKNLEENKEMAFLSRELVHIMVDAPVKLDLKAADVQDANPAKIADLFQQLSFKRLIEELPSQMKAEQQLFTTANEPKNDSLDVRPTKVIADTKELASVVPKSTKEVVLYSFFNPHESWQLPVLDGVLFTLDGKQSYLIEGKEKALLKTFGTLLQNNNIGLIGYDLKQDIEAWIDVGISLEKVTFDVMDGAFLLNALLREQTLHDLAQVELGIKLPEFERTSAIDHSLAGAVMTAIWKLFQTYEKQINKLPKVLKVAEEIEWPIIPVLARMEYQGIQLESSYLDKMSKDFEQKIASVTELIYKESKTEFNISSPAQLQTVLFETLALPKAFVKKTKTGYSTAASELEKLRSLHPIIDLITHYRELTKLKSTYVDALPKLVDKQGRLHTSFKLTVAQTGRLSSDNPNLMNIPVRTEAGRLIRNAFVAKSGNMLISADYSQFELRIAACLANDKNMIHAFNQGIDIHAMTAAELADKEIGDVTKFERRAAKVVNFGVLYGMSPHGLSVATGMTRDKAKEFIERYFEVRQPLVKYLDGLVTQAKADGYVETLFGRRRPVPDIHSSNFVVRNAAERQTMNMPIQGTAADLMKLAMIEVDKQLDDDCQMLLQIHDSILVEAPKAKAKKIAERVKKIMENIYQLPVRLDVDVAIGKNWGEL